MLGQLQYQCPVTVMVVSSLDQLCGGDFNCVSGWAAPFSSAHFLSLVPKLPSIPVSYTITHLENSFHA